MTITSPEGTRDLLPDEASFWNRFKDEAFCVFGLYGYVPIETPIIEQTDLFVRGIGEATDVVSKEMFTAISGENLKRLVGGGGIKDRSRLSLRPEGTAGVVRAVVQHDLAPQGAAPAKLMYAGQMFRAERPQKGRQRQFNQIGVECLGAADASVDAEAVIMLMRFFAGIGMPEDSMRLLLNSMGCDTCRPTFRDQVRRYLLAHADQICDACLKRAETNPLRAFDCKEEHCAKVMDGAPKIVDYLCDSCRAHDASVKELLSSGGISFCEEPKLVRGLDYYTRTVFEVQVEGGMGSQNAIAGGGRYDKLASSVGGRSTPGFGFALGYERCVLALQEAGVAFDQPKRCALFVACVDDAARQAAFSLVQRCRDEGIAADMDHQGRSLKSQFKLADKLGAAYVAVLGPDELATGSATLRNMATHGQRLLAIEEVPDAIAEAATGHVAASPLCDDAVCHRR